ncbi:hypothetical protein [Hydrogenophaga sp.]|uniref:hypothetical protein n=2 Tax=Hydrogenophaga sp. TaxID=1904254 RepID=UPI003D0BFF65
MEINLQLKASKEKAPSAVVPRTKKLMKVADVHFHPTNYAQQGTDPALLIATMDALKIQYTTLCPIPTNVLACGCGHDDHSYSPAMGHPTNQANYYISNEVIRFNRTEVTREEYEENIRKDAPLAYNQGVDGDTATRYNQLNPEQKDRFDPMMTGLVLGDLRCSEDLIRKLSNYRGVFTGVGEITVQKEWVEQKVPAVHQANLSDRSDGLKHLMQTCGVIRMPVVLHCDVDVITFDRRKGEPPKYFQPIKAFLADPMCKDTVIIWAHAGGLGKYSAISEGHLDRLREILTSPAHKHVYFDISWDTVAKQLQRTDQKDANNNPKMVAELVKLLSDFPDRFLFGSDSLSPNTLASWSATADLYNEVFNTLSKDASKSIRYGNYQRLLVGARQEIRSYEKHCIDFAMVLIDMRQDRQRDGFPDDVKAAVLEAAQDGINVGLALRELELRKTPLTPTTVALQKKLVAPDQLRLIATSIIDKSKPMPWDQNKTFFNNYLAPYRNRMKSSTTAKL